VHNGKCPYTVKSAAVGTLLARLAIIWPTVNIWPAVGQQLACSHENRHLRSTWWLGLLANILPSVGPLLAWQQLVNNAYERYTATSGQLVGQQLALCQNLTNSLSVVCQHLALCPNLTNSLSAVCQHLTCS
jgi:hypothetical protein